MATAQQQAEDLALKLKFEKKLKVKLRKFFKQVNADVNIIWRATGNLPDFDFYITDLTALLRSHYREVGQKFSRNIRDSISKKNFSHKLELKQEIAEALDVETVEEEESRLDAAVLGGVLLYTATHSTQQAKIILATTDKNYTSIVAENSIGSALNGDQPTQEEFADIITSDFAEKIDGKTSVISQTENQDMAEESKLIEARTIALSALLIGGTLLADRVNKIWNSVFLPTTRAHHAAADGQRAKLGQPFIVKGQQLQRPSDTSMGATADNVINCYCFTTFEIDQ